MEAVKEPADTAGPEVVDDTAKPEEAISTAVAEYSALIEGLARMRHELKDRVFDLTTVKGNDEARRARKTLVTTRTTLDRRRDDLKRELRASVATRIALLDTEADRLIGFVKELEIPIDQMIAADEDRRAREKKERDDAEAARTAAHRERITAISDVALRAVGLPSAEIQAKIELVTRVTIDASFEEFEAPAGNVKFETLLRLKELHTAAVASEEAAAKAQRDREELERLQREDRERQQREAQARIEQERLAAEQRRLEDEKRALQQKAEDARRAQSNAANELVEEIRRIQRRAITASGTGMLELLTLVENIRPGDELGDFVGVVQKAKDDAIADLHELHEQKLEQERQRLAQEKQRRADEDQARQLREARERNDMIMQQIEGIRQQTVIARVGRNPYYTGGNAADVAKIIAETEAWVIDAANFDGMVAIAQTVKDAALVDLRDYLAVLKTAEADAAREAEIRREQESNEAALVVDPHPAVTAIVREAIESLPEPIDGLICPGADSSSVSEAPPLVPFDSVQISGADTQSVELTPAPTHDEVVDRVFRAQPGDEGLDKLLDVGFVRGDVREAAMQALLVAVVDAVKCAAPIKRKSLTHWSVPDEQMLALKAALRAVPLPAGGYYSEDGTLMTADGDRSVFDDVEK